MRFLLTCLIASFVLAGPGQTQEGPLAGGEQTPAKVAAPNGPPKVTMRLHDGSVLVGTLALDAFTLDTVYGELKVPVKQIYRIEFGALPRKTELEPIAQLIKKLGDVDFKERERAHLALLELGPKALESVKAAQKTAKDQEIKRRVQALEKQIVRSQSGTEILDRIVARNLRVRGKLIMGPLDVQTRFGKLSVQPQDLAVLEFDNLRIALRETFDHAPLGWKFTAQNGTIWHISRKGSKEGKVLRCGLPDQVGYGNSAQAHATSPKISLRDLKSPVLRYRYRALFEEGADGLGLEISNDNGQEWKFISEHTAGDEWREQSVPLDAYKDGTIQLRFVFYSDESDTYEGVYIDDLIVTESIED